jgi:hypothetical protein
MLMKQNRQMFFQSRIGRNNTKKNLYTETKFTKHEAVFGWHESLKKKLTKVGVRGEWIV